MPSKHPVVLRTAALLVVAGCSADPDDGSARQPSSAGAGAAALDADFPDRDVLVVDGTYYASATNSAALNVQVATSRDLTTWDLSDTDALPELPAWVTPGRTWAPEVTHAIGWATSDAVTGPYTKAAEPLLSTGRFSGPGGQDVVVALDGTDRLVFHSWFDGIAYRGMDVLPLTWEDGAPVVPTD